MKAAVCTRYGPPESIDVIETGKPVPAAGEVLIRVRAASLNPLDWHMKKGKPYVMRCMTGLRRPKDPRLGTDVAGVVEQCGSSVTEFQAGDAVFGNCRGAFAEYACAAEDSVARKPENVTYEQASAAPVAGYTAIQGLRDKANVQPGQKVLVNGAAGGVGTIAVQVAKCFGAHVTAVCSTRNLELVRSIGADRVIDYSREDFTHSGERYDVIFDLVANHSLADTMRVLQPEGTYLAAGILGLPVARVPVRMLALAARGRFGHQRIPNFMARRRKEDLDLMRDLMASGKLTPVVGQCYRLDQVPDAIRCLEGKHARGKLIIVPADR